MLVTTINLVELQPGEYLEWSARPAAPGLPSDIPLSANQAFHLDGLVKRVSQSPTGTVTGWCGWLAVTFDVPGPVQRDTLTASFESLLRRHEALRCSFEVVEGEIRRRVHTPDDVALTAPGSGSLIASPGEARELLRSRIGLRCNPTRSPAALFAVVDRPGTSTVICGFDHSAVDSLSLALIAKEVSADYLARVQETAPAQPPEVGSFLEYCAYEHAQQPLAADHPGMALWRDFLAANGGHLPSLPLDLGVVPGEVAPQRTELVRVLDTDEADELEQLCRRFGGSLFAGELAALAAAVRDLGGPVSVPTLIPVHTRIRPEWEQAVGWFVTNIPLVFACGEDFLDGARRNYASFRAALPAAEIPIGHVLGGLAGPLALARKDVFMVSHVNYRKIFGPRQDEARRMTHISNSTVADDAQFWFSRTADGLWLRVRYPDTDIARKTVTQLRELLTAALVKELDGVS